MEPASPRRQGPSPWSCLRRSCDYSCRKSECVTPAFVCRYSSRARPPKRNTTRISRRWTRCPRRLVMHCVLTLMCVSVCVMERESGLLCWGEGSVHSAHICVFLVHPFLLIPSASEHRTHEELCMDLQTQLGVIWLHLWAIAEIASVPFRLGPQPNRILHGMCVLPHSEA